MEKKKIKIEIENHWTGKVLFEYEKKDNTIKATVVEAVKNGADLRGAYLRGAYLRGAYLRDAYLGEAYLRGADLGGADLGDADLGGADLRGADLRGADLGGADLRGAYLRGAYLRDAYLGDAYLRGAYLGDAYLRGADLGGADLRGAYLRGADLGDADLGGADLGGADLGGAKNIPFVPMYCPSDGVFIGWKKVKYQGGEYLVKLEIQEDSKRSSATRTKCRCDKAKVLDIILINSIVPEEHQTVKLKEIINTNYIETRYAIGEMVYADSWDDNRWNECSHGIHFFINRQEAEEYNI